MGSEVMLFRVYGDPVPQGSKRAFIVKDRAVVVDANRADLKTWRSQVVDAARESLEGMTPFEGPLKVVLCFYLRRPKRPKFSAPATRPDIDKLSRAVLDALTDAGVMRDDAQVTYLSAQKRYTIDTPQLEVMVSGVG